MGDIDEISEALGSIKSSVANLVSGHKETRDMLAVINDKVTQQGTDRILDKASLDALHKRVDQLEPIVGKHDERFRFAGWIIAGATSLITLLLNWTAPILGKLFP